MPILPYLSKIASELSDPQESSLTILARGLGLRTLICTLLKAFDVPHSLTLVVNATPSEEQGIGEELGMIGCRNPGLRIVGFEMPRKDRQIMYRKGGLISVTSRILTVDMLLCDIPIEKITGMIVMHAEKVTALDATAFIARLYRDKNTKGFMKAFSDQPEQITSGLSPLRNILKELQIRSVHIYPRFHEEIQKCLVRRKADIIELAQPMSESMTDIHEAIVNCINATINELKRSHTTIDLDDFDMKLVYFRSFDAIIRRQLDPIWHKVGSRTKRLVGDLTVLRNLLTYLVSYDPLAFHAYLETIVASNSSTANPLYAHENQSPWLTMDAANTIFTVAKRRCYVTNPAVVVQKQTSDVTEQDADWEVLDEIEGVTSPGRTGSSEAKTDNNRHAWERQPSWRPWWLPKEVEPVLEEQPKWSLLVEILHEVEQEINNNPGSSFQPGTNTVLIMTHSNRTCSLLREYLHEMDLDARKGEQGHKMMMRRLKTYLLWKADLHKSNQNNVHPSFNRNTAQTQGPPPVSSSGNSGLSEALQKKDKARQERASSRRRVRGGGPSPSLTSQRTQTSGKDGIMKSEDTVMEEAEEIADFLAGKSPAVDQGSNSPVEALDFEQMQFDSNYGLLLPEQTVIIRTYSDDTDDQVLAEIRPRFIIFYEPNLDFVRRVEVYRNSNPGLGVRAYFMYYAMSSEEHKYLAGMRREKESFERLIKERGNMLIPIMEERRADSSVGEAMIRTISTRIAGGGKVATAEPSQVIVDLREFRSTLPNLLHASNLRITPATLVVGDYILTPDICVERKSIPDLSSSFNNGRLYAQCELMSVHYKQPLLLIEFEEYKSFSLETVGELKSFAKPTGKNPKTAKCASRSTGQAPTFASIQAKLVLLTLTFPRVRIIWSSSPYATAEIFKDLKLNNAEPDPSKAVAAGAEDDTNETGTGWNLAAEELIRSLPGITVKNARYVMGKVSSVRELCALSLEELQEILGLQPGKECWEFIHHGEGS